MRWEGIWFRALHIVQVTGLDEDHDVQGSAVVFQMDFTLSTYTSGFNAHHVGCAGTGHAVLPVSSTRSNESVEPAGRYCQEGQTGDPSVK